MSKWVMASAVCASLWAPSAASAVNQQSVWDIVSQYTELFENLGYSSADAETLDRCGSDEFKYTLFVPTDTSLQAYLDSSGLTVSGISANPELARQIIGDHVMNGSMSPTAIVDSTFAHMVTWSGRDLFKSSTQPQLSLQVGANLLINNQFVHGYVKGCNGYVYFLRGVTYETTLFSVSGRTAPVPVNLETAPQLDSRPGKTPADLVVAGGLPNTL